MKAIVYEGMKNVKVRNIGDPRILNGDDIIVKVTSTAICGSDLHLIHGMVPNMPQGFVLGHESMGIVEETGKEVHKVKKGDRVIFLSLFLAVTAGIAGMICGASVITPMPTEKPELSLGTAKPTEAMTEDRRST